MYDQNNILPLYLGESHQDQVTCLGLLVHNDWSNESKTAETSARNIKKFLRQQRE